MSLWEQAESNEWLVVTRDGNLVQAGIGLSCFRGPFDTVAKIPSSLVKVEVETLQVTKEYQGVKVSSMIEWSINREGTGPLKALQNLNVTKGFGTANDVLSALTSAVVRNKISNSSIETIMKDRDEIRKAIMSEISEKAKGWGVHIGTVEITDMRIMSGSLFEMMQTQFREENNKKATLERLQVEKEIWRTQQSNSVITKKRDWDAQIKEDKAFKDFTIKKQRATIQTNKQNLALELQEKNRKRDVDLTYYRRQLQSEEERLNREFE